MHPHALNLVLDLAGTFVFALCGAMAGVKNRLNIFGVLVLSFAAANSGGIARDILIGATPPAAVVDWRYIAVTFPAGLITFYWFHVINRISNSVLVLDGAGLALFAVSGATKALVFHLNPLAAALLGMLTGIGGSMARDILLAEIPVVLRSEVYAVAALAGSAAVVVGKMMRLQPSTGIAVGATICFGLRLLAIYRGWCLPMSRKVESRARELGEKRANAWTKVRGAP